MTEASASVSFLASAQFLKTGSDRCWVPAFLLLTPPTTLVPYSMDASVWKVPWIIIIILRNTYVLTSHTLDEDFSVFVDENVGLGLLGVDTSSHGAHESSHLGFGLYSSE